VDSLTPPDDEDFFDGPTADPDVSDPAVFAVESCIRANDAAGCYDRLLLRRLAAAPGPGQRYLTRKLKAHFKADLNLAQFNADLRDIRAEIVAEAPAGSRMLLASNGQVKPNLANAAVKLAETCSLTYDTFANRIMHQKPTPWGSSDVWRDSDDLEGTEFLQRGGVNTTTAVTHEAAALIASRNEIHPVRDWLNSLTWDMQPRLDSWLPNFLGIPDCLYSWAAGSKWVLSCVARIMRPGCKADYMLVLEGAQRIGKSRALRALTNGHLDGDRGVQWFRDSLPDIEHKDLGLYLQGCWIIEVAELDAIRGKEWTRTKRFISSQVDSFRTPYGRNLQDYPRQCVFAGTTNDIGWGGDTTGLTRFWPMVVGKVDVDGIMAAREQLWAEAVYRYRAGEQWWLTEAEEALARIEQDARMPDDPWLELVARFVSSQEDVSVTEVLRGLNEKLGVGEAARCARCLNTLGWKRYRSNVHNGRTWRYRVGD
jgi:predicted P-loop ATPase